MKIGMRTDKRVVDAVATLYEVAGKELFDNCKDAGVDECDSIAINEALRNLQGVIEGNGYSLCPDDENYVFAEQQAEG